MFDNGGGDSGEQRASLVGGHRGGPDMTAGSSWHVLYLSHRDSTSSGGTEWASGYWV